MRVLSIISFTIAATIFTYLIGATLGNPVGQFSDDVAATTPIPDIHRDDVDATTPVVYADEISGVTGESVTHRARQEGAEEEDDDDDDATTVRAVSTTTRAPIPPPNYNESTILSELNFVSQSVPSAPVAVPVAPVVVPARPVEVVGATGAPVASEDEDIENEISQDEITGTTFKPSFAAEYRYTLQNFGKRV